MLESLLMLLVRLTGGRLADVFFGIGYEGSVLPCTSSHVLVSSGGAPTTTAPPHLDGRLQVWSCGGYANSILHISVPRMRERMTIEFETDYRSYVLEPSGFAVKIAFRLWPIPEDAPVQYSAGDEIPLELHMSRNWTKKVRLSVVDS